VPSVRIHDICDADARQMPQTSRSVAILVVILKPGGLDKECNMVDYLPAHKICSFCLQRLRIPERIQY
jgi:hypothetical protein